MALNWGDFVWTWKRYNSLYPVASIGGQIGGTSESPTIIGLRETSGPSLLTIGAVADGEFLKRSGNTIISAPASGTGTVTSVSITTANGISGSVATPTSTPAITLVLGAITPESVAASGTITGSNLSGTNTGDQTNITGNAATVTTNANLTGPITSIGNATSIANAAVTYAKIQNVTTARLLGRATSGSGVVEEITLGTNLSFTGTTLNATGGGSTPTGTGFPHITSGVQDAAAKLVDTEDINAAQVTYAKIQNVGALSIIGRSANSSGVGADITAGADGDVLRRSGTAIGFGSIPESSVTNLVSDLAGKVATTRAVNTASPLTGGGSLAADLTLDFDETVALGNNARVSVSKNSGATVGTRRRINFIEGSNVSLTVFDDAGNEEVDVTIASAGVTLSTVEKDLGSLPRNAGTFDITGLSGLTPAKPVLVQQAAGPYTGKGTLADEAEMDMVSATGYVVDATTIRVYWNLLTSFIVGNVKFNYTVSA